MRHIHIALVLVVCSVITLTFAKSTSVYRRYHRKRRPSIGNEQQNVVEIVEVFRTHRRPPALMKSDKSIENFLLCDAKCEKKRLLRRRRICLRTGRFCPTRPSRRKPQPTVQINVSARPEYKKPVVYPQNPYGNQNPDYTHLYPWSRPSVTVTKYRPDRTKDFNMTIVEGSNHIITTTLKYDDEYYDDNDNDHYQQRRSTTFKVPTENQQWTTPKPSTESTTFVSETTLPLPTTTVSTSTVSVTKPPETTEATTTSTTTTISTTTKFILPTTVSTTTIEPTQPANFIESTTTFVPKTSTIKISTSTTKAPTTTTEAPITTTKATTSTTEATTSTTEATTSTTEATTSTTKATTSTTKATTSTTEAPKSTATDISILPIVEEESRTTGKQMESTTAAEEAEDYPEYGNVDYNEGGDDGTEGGGEEGAEDGEEGAAGEDENGEVGGGDYDYDDDGDYEDEETEAQA